MTNERLRIELSESEREVEAIGGFPEPPSNVVAFEFSVEHGEVVIKEEWDELDASYGGGCRIYIPRRIWAQALPWIQARLAEQARGGGDA